MTKRLLPVRAPIAALLAWPSLAADLAIEDIVVTASRLGAVDQRVIVMDEEEVDRAGFHAADALRALPGFALSAAGHRGALTQARVRGGESNHLLVVEHT